MEGLNQRLCDIRRGRSAAQIWAAADAAQFVLNAFRNLVQANALPISDGPGAHYVFDLGALPLPPAPALPLFQVSDWSRHKNYVLGVLRDATGMRVTWDGGTRIELRPADDPLPAMRPDNVASPPSGAGAADPPGLSPRR
jgi:hypothetical protein